VPTIQKILLTILVAAVAANAAADPRFKQAAVESFQGERAGGLLFSRSNRCFVLTVGRVIAQGPSQVRTAHGHGEARQLGQLPEHDLGLLEVVHDDRTLCAVGELRGFELPAELEAGAAGPETATGELSLRRLADGSEVAEPVELASITGDEIVISRPESVRTEGWDGAVLWHHRRYACEPRERSEPLAILLAGRDRRPPEPAAAELGLLRLDRALELVERYLPRVVLRPYDSGPLRELPMPEELKPRLDTVNWVLRPSEAVTSRGRSGLQLSLDEGDWAPFPKKVQIPAGTRAVRLREAGRDDGGYYRLDLVATAVETMLREARKREGFLDCSESWCVFEAAGILAVVERVRLGARPDALTQELAPSVPIAEYVDYRGRSTRLLPAPVCRGTVYYQVELTDGYRTPVMSTEMRQEDEIVCPPEGFDFDDPRILRPTEEDGVPVFVRFTSLLFENRIIMRTFLDFEVAAITWAYDDGFESRLQRSSRELRFSADLEAERLRLELLLADGTALGPFSYEIDFFALKKLEAATQLDQRRFLQCFRVDPETASHYQRHVREYVREPSVVCLPRQSGGSAPNDPWIAVAAVEYGTASGRLDRVEPVDASKVTYSDCHGGDPEKCFLALVLPYDVEEVHARLRLWNGRRSETQRFPVH